MSIGTRVTTALLAAALTLASMGPTAASARPHVKFPRDCMHETYKPARIVVACGDGNLQMTGMHWSHWRFSNAVGFGTAHANDCVPNCAEGHFHTYSAKIKLTRLKYCANEGVEQYRRLSISYRGTKPTGPRSYSVPFPCPSAYARSSTTAGDPGASGAITARIKSKFPHARDVFANCPRRNTLPLQDGNTAIACEFRAVVGRSVRFGGGDAEQVNGQWQVKYFSGGRPVPDRWRSCSLHGLGGRGDQVPVRLRAHGIPCGDANFMANDIGAKPYNHNLRIPRHFTEAWYGTNSIGFVTNTFKCTGTVKIRQGTENPYGDETARCRSRFGDRFSYTFDQGS